MLDNTIKERISKKIKKILQFPEKRHFKTVGFFVDEVGQYSIVYRVFKDSKEVRFYFAGDHKDYEKWYKQFF